MPAANTNLNGSAAALSDREKKRLIGPALGSAFDPADRLFPSYGHGGVFDYGYGESKQLHDMLTRDGKARSIEQVLTLPLRGADHEVTGPNADFVNDTIPNLDLIIDQMTSACVYRKAFFEKVWKYENGRVVYDKLSYRPAQSCAAWYDEDTGDLKGFRQRTRVSLDIYKNGSGSRRNAAKPANQRRGGLKDEPGWVYVPIEKSFIYVHGLHRDPIRGISDMDVSYWAYETRKKIMFLWFQFLENTSLPKMVIYGDSQDEANDKAKSFALLKGSGVLGMEREPEGRNTFDTIDVAGQGAAQFEAAIRYLESMMTQSVLAGFMDLTSNAASGTGSFALSADQSEFFLTSRQAVADEMAQAINRNLIGPLITYNFGDVELPKIEIGPLSNRTTERSLDLLKSIVVAEKMNVPVAFVSELVKYTSSYLGLNEDEVAQQVDQYAQKRERDDEAQRQVSLKAAEAAAKPPVAPIAAQTKPNEKKPGGASQKAKPRTTNTSLTDDALLMSAAVEAAYDLVQLSEAGYEPKDLLIQGRA